MEDYEFKFGKKSKIIAAIAGLIILFFLLCFRTVGAGQVGIITRFGEVNRVATSGIALKLPFVESIVKMDTRVQKEEQDSTAATSDLQDVNAKLALNYALDNETAINVYKKIGKDYNNVVISPALQESFKASTSEYTANELITKRPEAKAKALEVIKDRLAKYGIRVVDLSITNLKYSDAFNAAIEQKQVAQQNAEKAVQDLARIKVEAEQAVVAAQGQAEAQRLQQTTLTDNIVALKQLDVQQQAINKWNGVLPTTQAGESTLFNIPTK
jgi:prohibitin 2